MSIFLNLLCVFLGGGFGALLRYLLGGLIQRNYITTFHYGTVAVNLIGALLIGFLWELFKNITISENMRLFIFMGLLGAFTTFSTFSLQTFSLIKDKEYILALVNVAVSNIACLVLVFSGTALARLFFKLLDRGKL